MGGRRAAARVAFMYIPHGAVMDRWLPAGAAGELALGPTMQSLAPWGERLTVVSGLTLPAAYVGEATAGANHTRASRCWLTCAPLRPARRRRRPIKSLRRTSARKLRCRRSSSRSRPASRSRIARRRRRCRWRRTRASCSSGCSVTAARPRSVPRGSGSSRACWTPSPARSRRCSAACPQPIASASTDTSTDIRELERRLALAADSTAAELEVPDKPSGVPADFEEHAALMFDLLSLAWQGDLTRVATLLVAREVSNRVYARSGITEGFHNCSHHSELPANIDRLARLNEYHTRRRSARFCRSLGARRTETALARPFARRLRQRHEQREPTRSRPIADAARAADRGAAGWRHIAAPEGTPAANFLVGVLNKLDVPLESFADSTGAFEI